MHCDYVVVGAGTGGCALAARLAELPGVSVVLLEAGPTDDTPDVAIPANVRRLFKTERDWDFSTDPEPGLAGRRGYLPRGRGIGGSGSINGMVYIRGNAADFDEWEALGNPGWGYRDVLPYFKRSEDNERGADEYYGAGGPSGVSDGRSGLPVIEAWLEAAVQARGYLPGGRATGNLTVLTGTYATRVELRNRRAVAVHAVRDGEPVTIAAGTEIIVCAGAYQSPQLLMLSGIGPAAQLARQGIDVLEDLAVGENLLDHPTTMMSYLINVPGLSSAATPEAMRQYETERRGPLTSNMAEAGGFLRSRPELDLPDIQLHAGVGGFQDEGLVPPPGDGHSLSPNIAKPTSVGAVMLRSSEPKLCMEIVAQPATQAVHTGPLRAPASAGDADISDFIDRACQTNYHPAGTCAMGSVLDPELRVKGIDGLRVADASAFPTMIRGNINAAVIMIAERAADLITGRPAAVAPAEAEGVRA